MKFGKIKTLALVSALALTVGVSASTAGCSIETRHPRAKITFQIVKSENDVEEYSLEYVLHRDMYPQTVRHFIELAKAGFYDNTIVHDYYSGEWVAGLFDYEGYAEYNHAVSDDGVTSNYFIDNAKDEDYLALFASSSLTASVYSNIEYKLDKDGKPVYDGTSPVLKINDKYALPTVMGEFRNNIQQEIKNGALTSRVGTLKMIYYPESDSDYASDKKVYVTPTSDQIIGADFKYNSATSAFSVQLGTSQYHYNDYCVFGEVRSDDDLQELKDAVAEYFAETYEEEDYYVTGDADVTVYLPDAGEGYSADFVTELFKLPKTAIVIKSVKITKN